MYFIYMLASGKRGYLYVGQTIDLLRRTVEHQRGVYEDAYTRRVGIHKLVYWETCMTAAEAAKREAQLKRYPRAFKFNLIEGVNPDWTDMSVTLRKHGLYDWLDSAPTVPEVLACLR